MSPGCPFRNPRHYHHRGGGAGGRCLAARPVLVHGADVLGADPNLLFELPPSSLMHKGLGWLEALRHLLRKNQGHNLLNVLLLICLDG